MGRAPGSMHKPHNNTQTRNVLVVPALRSWRQGDQELKVLFRYRASLRPTYALRDPAIFLKTLKKVRKKMFIFLFFKIKMVTVLHQITSK